MLELLLRGYSGLVWPLFLADVACCCHSPECVNFYRSVIHHPAPWAYVLGIFIFRRCMVRHPRFSFSLASQPLSQNSTTWGSGAFVAPPFPYGSQSRSLGVSLVFPGLYSVRFTCFGFLVGGSDPSSMGVLGHSLLVCPWCYLGRFWSFNQTYPELCRH